MANIDAELQHILNSVYGKDVRNSIHDGIDKINKVGEKVLTIGNAVNSPSSSISGYFDNSLYINANTMDLWRCTGTQWELVGTMQSKAFMKFSETDTHVDMHDTYATTDIYAGFICTSDATPPSDPSLYSWYYIGTAVMAESWAVGGTGKRAGEDTNNAKYYALQAKTSETNAATSETNAAASAATAAALAITIQQAEANAKQSELKAAASEANAKTSEDNAKLSETNAATSETNAKQSEDNASDYWDMVHEAAEKINPKFVMNWATGELEYEGNAYSFYVDNEGYLHWGVE